MEGFWNFTKSFTMPNMNFVGGGMGITSNKILYAVFFVLIILLIMYLYSKYFTPLFQSKFIANNEMPVPNESNSKNAELLFFYAEWCPHCKTAKPVWEDTSAEYENKTINGYNVTFTEVNCTTENGRVESLMNKYKIEGFPTIKLVKDGQVIEFDAKPTKENLTQFLNTAL